MIAIYYEHPEWFKPLFAELDRRGLPYTRLAAHRHRFDPEVDQLPYRLLFNRMSPSAYVRGHGQAIFYTHPFLAYLDEIGLPVINGHRSWILETSKARQLALFRRLGLRYPRARVIDSPQEAPAAAQGLEFPVVVKPNIGGSGANIVRFDSQRELEAAVPGLELGLDSTALVQELLPARGEQVVRVEVLGGSFLYAIRLRLTDTFNLCPADYCLPEGNSAGQSGNGRFGGGLGSADGLSGRIVTGYQPPPEAIRDVERITAAAQIDVGGVEYLVNDRDGERYYYDVNALSNFVADAPNVIGFDPFERLGDWLEERVAVLA